MTLASSGYLSLGGPSSGNSSAETSVNVELNGIDSAVTPTSPDSMISADNDSLLGNSNRPRVFPPDWYGASALPPQTVAYWATVAGGGGGAGGGSYTIEGKSGGGAGGVQGYLYDSSAYILSVSGRYQVIVGGGGGGGGVSGYPSGVGNTGNDTYWYYNSNIVGHAYGGGFGADGNTEGGSGGSGGGVTNAGSHWDGQPGGAGITGQGNYGGNGGHKGPGGGGGGNGAAGESNLGGQGNNLQLPTPYFSSWRYGVAGGGGGGGWRVDQNGGGLGGSATATGGGGGLGGDGAWAPGANRNLSNGTNGAAATGSGGGGATSNQSSAGTGGNGGGGVVIFAYTANKQLFSSNGNGVQTFLDNNSNIWWIHTFSSSGYLQGVKYTVPNPVTYSGNYGSVNSFLYFLYGWDQVTPVTVNVTQNITSTLNTAALRIADYYNTSVPTGRITVNIQTGVTIEGGQALGAIYIRQYGPATINNFGTITGYLAGGTEFGPSVYMQNGSANSGVIFNNYGTLDGNVQVLGITFNNYGTVTGNITNTGGTTNNHGTVTGTIS